MTKATLASSASNFLSFVKSRISSGKDKLWEIIQGQRKGWAAEAGHGMGLGACPPVGLTLRGCMILNQLGGVWFLTSPNEGHAFHWVIRKKKKQRLSQQVYVLSDHGLSFRLDIYGVKEGHLCSNMLLLEGIWCDWVCSYENSLHAFPFWLFSCIWFPWVIMK